MELTIRINGPAALVYHSHGVRGASLYLVGKLIGHTQAATTQRYVHVPDATLCAVTNDFGEVLEMLKRRA